jgi:hypothetical protein
MIGADDSPAVGPAGAIHEACPPVTAQVVVDPDLALVVSGNEQGQPGDSPAMRIGKRSPELGTFCAQVTLIQLVRKIWATSAAKTAGSL